MRTIQLRYLGANFNDGVNKADGLARCETDGRRKKDSSYSELVGTLISRSAPPIDFKSKKGAIGSDPLFLSSDLCRIRALIAAPINGVEVCWSSVNYLFFGCCVRSLVRMKCDIPLPLISSQHRQRSRSGRGEAVPPRRRQRLRF